MNAKVGRAAGLSDDFVYARGAIALRGLVVRGRLLAIGTRLSASFRWLGWSSSCAVLDSNTELALSNATTPSGFGYPIFGAAFARARRA
jgi:hypothetical protein